MMAWLQTCWEAGSYMRAVIRDSWPLSAGLTNSMSFGWSSKRCCGGRSYLLCTRPPCASLPRPRWGAAHPSFLFGSEQSQNTVHFPLQRIPQGCVSADKHRHGDGSYGRPKILLTMRPR